MCEPRISPPCRRRRSRSGGRVAAFRSYRYPNPMLAETTAARITYGPSSSSSSRRSFLGGVVGVGARLAGVEVWWGDPLGVAVPVFAGCPALFGERVVTAAAECQIV